MLFASSPVFVFIWLVFFVTVVNVVYGFPQCTPGYGYGHRGSCETTIVLTSPPAPAVFVGAADGFPVGVGCPEGAFDVLEDGFMGTRVDLGAGVLLTLGTKMECFFDVGVGEDTARSASVWAMGTTMVAAGLRRCRRRGSNSLYAASSRGRMYVSGSSSALGSSTPCSCTRPN